MQHQNPHDDGPITVAPDSATARHLHDLAEAGFGAPSEIIRAAVERLWAERLSPLAAARLEVWTLAEDEGHYAIVLVDGSPFVATGPLRDDELLELADPQAGVTVFAGWSDALAEELHVKRDQYDRRLVG